MLISSLAALGAAFCWSISGLIALRPVRLLGTILFNRWRMYLVFGMLSLWLLPQSEWRMTNFPLLWQELIPLFLSAFVGILLGDIAFFFAVPKLGPRATGLLFATHAPITIGLAWIFLAAQLSFIQFIGAFFVITGVMLAILYGRSSPPPQPVLAATENLTVAGGPSSSSPPKPNRLDHWEPKGQGWHWGIASALFAAFCQSAGVLLAKPVMVAGVDPLTAAWGRTGVALIGFECLWQIEKWRKRQLDEPQPKLDGSLYLHIGLNGMTGMVVGMSLLLFALAHGHTGLVGLLSSTTPVMMLPLLWFIYKQPPRPAAWVGALLCVLGTALILGLS
jgi:drug/metabolite transporter (DMT)-like permease